MSWQSLGMPPSVEWAKKLREREKSGEHLTLFQQQAWREALQEPAREIADRAS